MERPLRRIAFAAAVVVMAALVVGVVLRRASPETEQAATESPVREASASVSSATTAGIEDPLAALGVAFRSGRLPAPASQPPGNPEEAAAVLAGAIMNGGPSATPSLLAALQMAGIAVGDSQGRLLVEANGPGQATVFSDWEVAAMAKMVGNGYTVSLRELGSFLAEASPALKEVPVAELLVRDVRELADTANPRFRFWGRFILELGRASQPAYDLSAPDLRDVRMNAVQVALILRRLSRDIQLRLARAEGGWLARFPLPPMQVLAAGFPPVGGEQASLPNCSWDGTPAAPTADEVALGFGYGFGTLIGYLDDAGVPGAAAVAALTGVANIALAYVRLIWAYATLDSQITMTGAPVVRPRDRSLGQPRDLTAHLEFKSGNAHFVNCVRQALNVLGLDFSLPADGPLSNAGVEWILVEGQTVVRTKSDYGIEEAIVEFVRNPTDTRTDDQGNARIQVRGAPQAEPLPSSAVPVQKQFKVRVNIQLEAPTVRAAAAEAGGLLTGPLGVLTLPASLLMKTRWASSKTYSFPLTDWEACTGDWMGDVTFNLQMHSETTVNKPRRTETVVNRYSQVVHFSLQGVPDEAARAASISYGDVSSQTVYGDVSNQINGMTSHKYTLVDGECTLRFFEESSDQGSGDGKFTATVLVNGGYYEVRLRPAQEPTGTSRWSRQRNYSGRRCFDDTQEAGERPLRVAMDAFKIEGQVDHGRPNVLRGQKTIDDVDSKLTINWALRRCK